ncbi:hypothetical protein VTI74DRAFT_527 [Chaetomium olivicolor]
MRFLSALASALAYGTCLAEAKAVFAHFMVGNTKAFGLDDWKHEIQLAQDAQIDAFALNMANDDSTNDAALPLAFNAAEALNFKLFFSFDYAGNGPWPKSTVTDMINKYGQSVAYFKRGPQPFVSTFEGPGNAEDWHRIKADTNCFFIPDWSSIGAQPAVKLAGGVADGLFSWDAWPKGPANMTTYPDASYYDFLGDKPYMMPISPWFYTNLPGYGKNWLWRGDDMWFQRWQQAISIDRSPDYIQIISWNDYGESHYIGPLDERQYEAFDIGRAPFNYVRGMPHDGWRETLPYYIKMYKFGTASITQERLVSWYRLNKNGACSDGGTTGNTAQQLQLEYSPNEMMQDRIFYDALLTKKAQVQVSIGGQIQAGTWDQEPNGGIGVYHGSVPIGSASGPVVVTLIRGGTTIATINGASITSSCTNGLNNYNPWVGSARGSAIDAVLTLINSFFLKCVKGFGVYEFTGVCDFACSNGYCPSAACICLKKGFANPPNETGEAGYPLPGKSGSFQGLCSFDCNHGYCPDTVCGHTSNDGVVLNYSPFLPPACTGGTGSGAFAGLCNFGCNFGFCPRHVCTCTATGVLNQTPPKTNITGYYRDSSVDDHGLCKFACEHGYCPDVCGQRDAGDDGKPGKYLTITLDPAVWGAPTAQCAPPCVMVLPPSSLAAPTTISFNELSTSLEFMYWSSSFYPGLPPTSSLIVTTVTTVISIPPVITNRISYSDVLVTTTLDGAVPSIILPTVSVSPPPFVVTLTPPNFPTDATPVPRTILPPPWPWNGQAGNDTLGSTSRTSSTDVPIIVFPTGPFPTTAFPTETATWVTNWVSEPTTTHVNGNPDDSVPVIPCWAWFVWNCPPGFGGVVLSGFKKPGIYPPGGPPNIGPNPPPGVTLKIPWPQITIGPDIKPTYPLQPDPEEDSCETATASICTTTLSYGVVLKRDAGAALATPAPWIPFEEFRKLSKRAVTTTTSTITFCTKVTGCGATDITETSSIAATATPTPRILIPRDPKNVDGIRSSIRQQPAGTNTFWESKTDRLGTIFFFVPSLTDEQTNWMRQHPQVLDAYVPRGQLTANMFGLVSNPSVGERLGDDERADNSTAPTRRSALSKRAENVDHNAPQDMTLISWPPNAGEVPFTGDYKYDSSAGDGTYLYSCDYGLLPTHPEFSDIRSIFPLFPGPNPKSDWMENDEKRHGTACMSRAIGKTVGIARKARLVATVIDYDKYIYEHFLDALAQIHDDIYIKGRGTKSVVNISISISTHLLTAAYLEKMAWLFRELHSLGVVIVTGSGNKRRYPYGYPALFGDPQDPNYIPDLIVVGSVIAEGVRGTHSNADWLTCYAPGYGLRIAEGNTDIAADYRSASGTSYASAIVAGLAAYFRGLDATLTTAASVKQRIVDLSYRRQRRAGRSSNEEYPDKVVWNGQQGGRSIVDACGGSKKKRGSGGSCPVQFPPDTPTLTFRTGPAQPTCSSGSACGSACKGFFCAGSPLKQNPDFLDPANPDSVQNPDSPYYGDWDGTKPRVTVKPTTASYTISPISSNAPAGPTPKPGSGLNAPKWGMAYYDFRDNDGRTIAFVGFDDGNYNCRSLGEENWRQEDGAFPGVPDDLHGLKVYGDPECEFRAYDMSLRCKKWATAKCTDMTGKKSGMYGGGGTCEVNYPKNIYQQWQAILMCTWS